jgi:fucose 4-O-acetylase-like acetyltransferase
MPTARDPHLDNVRAVLIALVVVGHVAQQGDSRAADVLSTWIYAFHMPAFVLVSGYLSRRYEGSGAQVWSIVRGLLVPYVIFQVLLAGLQTILFDAPFNAHLTNPAFSLWFLLALAAWRLLTPVLRSLRHPLALAVAISVLAPFDPGLDQQLSAARILGFLPFYVLGLQLRPEHLTALRRPGVRAAGAACLTLALGAALVLAPRFSIAVFYLNGSYGAESLTDVSGAVVRALALLAGLLGTAAVLAVVPASTQAWTRVGTRTLYVYTWQAVFLYPLTKSDLLAAHPWQTEVTVAVLGGLLLTLLLGSGVWVALTRRLTEPRAAWLKTHPATAAQRHAEP